MKKETYILSLIACIIILICIIIYFYLVEPRQLSYYSLEGFSKKEGAQNMDNQRLCGKFLDDKNHYKNANTPSGTLGPMITNFNYNKKINKPEEIGAGLKKSHGEFTLCDHYVMSAYNCCSTGRFDRDEVSTCALENSIRFGARCLDFAIYSASSGLPNAMEPIISYSNRVVTAEDGTVMDNYYAKASENVDDLTLDRALAVIKQNAFAGGITDPLILHFRIKTGSEDTLNQMHDLIVKHFNTGTLFNRRLLDKKYGYCGEAKDFDINSIPMKNLEGKVIILVDNYGNKFKKTKLYKITNSSTGSFKDVDTYHSSFRNYTITDLKTQGTSDISSGENVNRLEHYNKTHLAFLTPDKTEPTNNIHNANDNNMIFAIERGVQFIGMSFQQFDSSLQYYLSDLFSSSSFVLKPRNLRAVPILMDVPTPQKKNQVDPATQNIDIAAGTDIVFPVEI